MLSLGNCTSSLLKDLDGKQWVKKTPDEVYPCVHRQMRTRKDRADANGAYHASSRFSKVLCLRIQNLGQM